MQPNPPAPVTARANPFATCHLERIPFRFPAGKGWDTLLKRIEELKWCASIVGDSLVLRRRWRCTAPGFLDTRLTA